MGFVFGKLCNVEDPRTHLGSSCPEGVILSGVEREHSINIQNQCLVKLG